MRDETQEVAVALFVFEVLPDGGEDGAVEVLEAAALVGADVVDEEVALVGERAAKHRGVGFDQCTGIFEEAGQVDGRLFGAPEDEVVRLTEDVDGGDEVVGAELYREVGERVVVGDSEVGDVEAAAGEDAPSLREVDREPVGEVGAAFDKAEQVGASEEGVRAVNMGRADRAFVAVGGVANDDLVCAVAGDAPAALRGLFDGRAAWADRLDGELAEVAGELTHEVAAGRPDGEVNARLTVGFGDAKLDRNRVVMRVGNRDAVVGHGEWASWRWDQRGSGCSERAR